MVIQVRSTSHQVWSKKASSGTGTIASAAIANATTLAAPSELAQTAPPARSEALSSIAPPASQTSTNAITATAAVVRPGTYYDAVVGAVVFDWNGLPQEYFVIPESELLPWEQTVFQMLGLRWLLMSYLNLGGFYHAKVSCENYSAFVVRQREYYMAILLERSDARDSDPAFMEWLQAFEVSYLRTDPRFQHH